MDAKKYFSSLVAKESFSPQERLELKEKLNPRLWLPLKEIEPRWEAIQGVCLQQKMPELIIALMPIIEKYRFDQAINLAKGANFRGGLTLEEGFEKFSGEVIAASEKVIEERFADITWASQKLSSDPKKISALFGQVVKRIPKVEEAAKNVIINVCRTSVVNRSKSAYFAACKLLEYNVEINLKEVFESVSYEQQKKLHKLGYLNLTRAFQLKFSFERGELKKIHTFVGKVSLKDVKEAFSPCKDPIAVLAPFAIDALQKGESIDILIPYMNKGKISPFEDQFIATKQWDELIKLYALYSRADVQRFIEKLPEDVRLKAQSLALKKGCLKALYEMKAVVGVKALPKQPSLWRLGLLLLAGSKEIHDDVNHLIKTNASFHPIIEEAYGVLKARKMLDAWPVLRKKQLQVAKDPKVIVKLMQGANIQTCLGYLNGNREQVLMELLRRRPMKDWDTIVKAFPEGAFPKKDFLKWACARKDRLEIAIQHLGEDPDLIKALLNYKKDYPENIVGLIETAYEQIDPKRLPLNALVHYAGLVIKKGETEKFASTRHLIDCYKGSKSSAAAEVIRDVLPFATKEASALLNGLIFAAKDPLAALKGCFASKDLTEDQLLIRTTLLANACPMDRRRKRRIYTAEDQHRELFRHQGHRVNLLQDYMGHFVNRSPLVKLFIQEVGASHRTPDEKMRIFRKFFHHDYYEKNEKIRIRDVVVACDLMHEIKAPRFVQVGMVALYAEAAFNLEKPGLIPSRRPKQDVVLVQKMWGLLPGLFQEHLLPKKAAHSDLGLCLAIYGADLMAMAQEAETVEGFIELRKVLCAYPPVRGNLHGAKYFDNQSVQFAQFLIANGYKKHALDICEHYSSTRPFHGDVDGYIDVQTLLLDWSPKWGILMAERRTIATEKETKSFYQLQPKRLMEALRKVLKRYTNEKDLNSRLELLRRLKRSSFSDEFIAGAAIDSWNDLYKTKSTWATDHAFHYLIELQGGIEPSEKTLIEGLRGLIQPSDKERLKAIESYKRDSTEELVKRGIDALTQGENEVTALLKERRGKILESLEETLLPLVNVNLSAKQLRLLQQLLRFVGDPKVVFPPSIKTGLNKDQLKGSLALATLVIGTLQQRSGDWRSYHKKVCLSLFNHYPQHTDLLLKFMDHTRDDTLLRHYLLVLCKNITAPWAVSQLLKVIRLKEDVLDGSQVCQTVAIALRKVEKEHDRARLMAVLANKWPLVASNVSRFLSEEDRGRLGILGLWLMQLTMHNLSSLGEKIAPLYIAASFNYSVPDLSSFLPEIQKMKDDGVLYQRWFEKEADVQKLIGPYDDKAISSELDSARVKIALMAPLDEAWKLRSTLEAYYGDPDLWWQLEYRLWKSGKHTNQLEKEENQPRIWNGQKLVSLKEHNSKRYGQCLKEVK